MALAQSLVQIVAQPASVVTIPVDDLDNRLLQVERAVAALNANVAALEPRVTAVETRPPAGAPVTVAITAAQETALAALTAGTLVRLQGPTASFYAVAQ